MEVMVMLASGDDAGGVPTPAAASWATCPSFWSVA